MTTDADKIDNLLAQRRELMDKIEEQIDERGRIIERIQSAPDTPIDRLRAQHRHCSCWGENCGVKRYPKEDWNSHCEKCAVTWPCDTIAALDALDARLAEYRKTATNMRELHDQLDDENEALEARLDAATALIWGAQMDEHMNHGASLKRAALRACEHPNCAPYRDWLAGDKEAGNE